MNNMKKNIVAIVFVLMACLANAQIDQRKNLKLKSVPESSSIDSILTWEGPNAQLKHVKYTALLAKLRAYFDPLYSGSVTVSGLEAINEGNGVGYRIIGRDSANFGNIGLDAVDFSQNTTPSSTWGATGSNSLAGGEEVNTSNYGISWGATISDVATSGYNYYHFNFGANLTSKGFSAFNFGYNNLNEGILTGGANYSSVFGRNNNSYSTVGITAGAALYSDAVGVATFGQANTNYTGTGGSSNLGTSPIFVVGNGTVDGNFNAITRSDAFKILFNGIATFPSLSTAEIDGEASGKVAVTKEWVQAQGFSTSGGGVSSMQDIYNSAVDGVGTASGASPDGLKNIEFGISDINGASIDMYETNSYYSNIILDSGSKYIWNGTGNATYEVGAYKTGGSSDGAYMQLDAFGDMLFISNTTSSFDTSFQNGQGASRWDRTTNGGVMTRIEIDDPIGVNSSVYHFTSPATLDADVYIPNRFTDGTNTVYTGTTGIVDLSPLSLGGGATNLSYTASPTNGTVASDSGTDATIPLADGTNAGLITPAEKTSISTALQPADISLTSGYVAVGNGSGISGTSAFTWNGTDLFLSGNFVLDGTNIVDANNVNANAFIKSGGTGTNALMDDGSVKDLSNYNHETITIALSDAISDLTTGDKDSFHAPYNFTIVNYWVGVNTAPAGSSINVDLKKNGVSMTSTQAQIAAGQDYSEDSSGTSPVLTTTSVNKYDKITPSISQIGSTTAGAGLKLYIEIIKN